MNSSEKQQAVKTLYFDQARPRLLRLAGRLVNDAPPVVEEAAAIFDAMLPDMAYVEKPQHPLAPALFIGNVNLALYLALRQRGVDVHTFGSALLTGLARAPIPPPAEESAETMQARLAQFVSAAEASQRNPAPGEDVFEVAGLNQADFDWGYNITSCSICQSAAKYAAMEFVPYLCATDDVMSDKGQQGLRRSGSLALGAPRCDFRYQRGGSPQRLAEQYPEQIRHVQEPISTSDSTKEQR